MLFSLLQQLIFVCLCAWCPPLSRYCGSLNRDFPLPVRVHRVQSRPAGQSDYPQCRLRRCSYTVVPPKPPRQSGRVPLRQPSGWGGGSPSWHSVPVSQCGPQLQPSVPNSGLAVCSCLSAAPCYKANVICSVKCRPQTVGSANSQAAETLCPAGGWGGSPPHTGSGAAPGPSVWPLAGQRRRLMPAATRANDSHFPPGLRRSRRPLRIRPRICSEWFVLSCTRAPPPTVPSLKF